MYAAIGQIWYDIVYVVGLLGEDGQGKDEHFGGYIDAGQPGRWKWPRCKSL